MREEIRSLFHEYFDLLAVLQAYVVAMKLETRKPRSDQDAANELEMVTNALSERAEAIRARVFNLVG